MTLDRRSFVATAASLTAATLARSPAPAVIQSSPRIADDPLGVRGDIRRSPRLRCERRSRPRTSKSLSAPGPFEFPRHCSTTPMRSIGASRWRSGSC